MQVRIGNIRIGAGLPVTVQSMYDRPLDGDIDSIIEKLNRLKAMGCDIFRFAFVSEDEAPLFEKIASRSPMPLVADIHFDYKLALKAMDLGFSKVRINPGNIGSWYKTEEIVKKASDCGVAIRIGLNSGSLPKGDETDRSQLMVDSALSYLDGFEKLGFKNTVVSLKSSDPEETFRACRLFNEKCAYPQHLGITEAGSVITSAVRSTWTLGRLLSAGIGNTIRYSINGPVEYEVQAAVELLRTLGLRKGGVRIVACPRCGRYSFDSQGFLASVEQRLLSSDKECCVAFMGCQVNGPGEAKHADLAVTGIGNSVFLYKKGELYRKISADDAEKAFWDAFEEL